MKSKAWMHSLQITVLKSLAQQTYLKVLDFPFGLGYLLPLAPLPYSFRRTKTVKIPNSLLLNGSKVAKFFFFCHQLSVLGTVSIGWSKTK